jgi:4-hydroxybutyrate dehydrogenase
MDAVAHCIETFLSPRVNPPAYAIALDGLARAVANLERAVSDGADRQARWHMMMAAMQGALCFQKGLGAVHSMSHPLGSLGYHHGTLNAVLLPHVLAFNAPATTEKTPRLAQSLGLSHGTTPAEAIAALNARIGMPESLGAMGVTEQDLGGMAEMSLIDGAHATNPRPLDLEAYRGLYRQALGRPAVRGG